MSQSAIDQVILEIRVRWILRWAEHNKDIIRAGQEVMLRVKQDVDWSKSIEKAMIDDALRHDDDMKLKCLRAIETTYRLAPHMLAGYDEDEEDDEDDEDDDYEDEDDDYEQYNHDPLPPAQHLVLDTVMDEDPSNM
jgi:hypothetical protein